MGSHEPFKRFITADPSWRVLFIKDFHTFFFFLAYFFFVEFPFLFFVGFCFLSLLLLRRFYGGLTAGWRWVSGGRSGWPASTTRAASWRNAVDAVVDDDEVIWNETNVCRNEEECHRFSSSSSPFFWLLCRFFLNFFYVRACVCVCVCGTEGKFFIWKIKVKKKTIGGWRPSSGKRFGRYWFVIALRFSMGSSKNEPRDPFCRPQTT